MCKINCSGGCIACAPEEHIEAYKKDLSILRDAVTRIAQGNQNGFTLLKIARKALKEANNV